MKIFVKNALIKISITKEIIESKNSKKLQKTLSNFLNKALKTTNSTKTLEIKVCQEDYIEIYKVLLSKFNLVKAAGGVVINNKNKVLTITRNGYLDLPKGKVEKNESYISAAPREVSEECGISDIQITGSKPIKTWHAYYDKKRWYLKKTKWYKMRSNQNSGLNPQVEEGITSVDWRSKDSFLKKETKTFANIKIALSLIE